MGSILLLLVEKLRLNIKLNEEEGFVFLESLFVLSFVFIFLIVVFIIFFFVYDNIVVC